MNQVFVISGGWWLPGQRMEPGDSVALEMTNVRTAADRMLAREIRLHALIRRNRRMDFADGGLWLLAFKYSPRCSNVLLF